VNCVGRRLLGLCLPPLLFCALDCSLTLAGQSEEYWAGNYQRVNEMSPTFKHLLEVHPVAFALGNSAWAASFVGVILLLPDVLALIASIAVTLGHTVGAATWILWRFHYGYQAGNLLFACAAVALGLGIYYGWRAAPSDSYRLFGLSMALRWVIALVLVGVAVYLFLWPRQA
jgi:hypothetical protein